MASRTNMSTEDRQRMYQAAQKCNFSCLFLVCTVAFSMSLYATGFCAFVSRDVVLQQGNDIASVCANFDIPQEQCTSMLGSQGVGFWAWEMTLPVDQQACFSYTQYVDGIGYVTPRFDRQFNSAKACQGVAVFFGALAWFTMAFSLCCPLHKSGGKCLSFYFFIAFLFQSLAFLIFKSDICKPGFFNAYFGGTTPAGIESVSCSRNRATNMAIAAVVLYFYAMSLVPGATAPDPIINYFGTSERQAGATAEVPEAAEADKNGGAGVDDDVA
ncbi:hypothetical protein MPSEU_000933500 [Mayamaea pseudoterrestris]|nr:hypothetical protein MPSEU_000933500 [Mayamaea pseudoterrestris]